MRALHEFAIRVNPEARAWLTSDLNQMNVEAAHEVLVEELRTLVDANTRMVDALGNFPHSGLNPTVGEASARIASSALRQVALLESIFQRLDVPSAGGHSSGARGILIEFDEIGPLAAGSESHNLDARVMPLLRKLLAYRTASLKSLLITAHAATFGFVEGTLMDALKLDLEEEDFLDEICSPVLRLDFANSREEIVDSINELTPTH